MTGSALIGALHASLGLDTAEFTNGVKEVKGQLGALGKIFSGLAAAGVFTAFSAGIGQAVGRIEEMRKLSSQLDRALANTGNTARTSAAEIADFADDLQRATGRAAEEVMAVSTNLATYGFGREVFYEALTLADDMAAAWGGDLKQNAEGLARALADPEKGLAMLTKRGITFTDEQKKMIAGFVRANDLVGAQGVVLDALNAQVKGVAEAGFGGLAKASANAWLGVEDFFEGIANGMQLNLGLELALIGVAGALRLVTDNMGTVGRVAAVVGAALAVAIGPAVWGMLAGAAVAFGQAVIAALAAVRVAVMANPIGAIAMALAAVVTAAFVFRDEIKKVIGVDFVGIIGTGVNFVIGAFVAAFDNIKTYWAHLPAAMGDIVVQAANATIGGIEGMLNGAMGAINEWMTNIEGATGGLIKLGRIEVQIDLPELNNPWAGRGGMLADEVTGNIRRAMSVDYVGELGKLFDGVGDSVAAAGGQVQGFGDIVAEATAGGGAGVDKLTGKVNGLGGAVSSVKDSMGELWGSMKSGLAGMASGVTKAFFATEDAASKALNAVVSGLESIANKALDMAFSGIFDMIFGAIGGVLGGNSLGGGWGVAGGFGRPGIFGIPGLATGGRTMTAGLVEVGERGRELINLPAGAQVIRHNDIGETAGGGGINMPISIDARNAQKGVGAEIARALSDFSKRELPARIAEINRNPHRR